MEYTGTTPVSALTGDEVARIPQVATLLDAARKLVDADVGLVVIGDGNDVSGVISERDIVRAAAEGRDLAATKAEELASKELVWCDAAVPIAEVATEMMERYVRHVLIEENGRLSGIVSARDLLSFYAASDSAE